MGPRGSAANVASTEVADVIRQYGDGFLERYGGTLSAVQRRALRDLAVCEAAYESNLAGRPVGVFDVLEGRVEEYQRPINEHWGIGAAP